MEKLLTGAIWLSLEAMVWILLVWIIRRLWKTAPKAFFYRLWLLPFLRLLIPWSIPVSWHTEAQDSWFMPYLKRLTAFYADTGRESFKIDSFQLFQETIHASQGSGALSDRILWAAAVIWLGVAAALLVKSFLEFQILKHRIKRKSTDRKNIKYIDMEEGAFVYGILHPVICISSRLKDREREYILTHEIIHVKREDYFIKGAAYILCCIYWFQPAVWLAFRGLTRDMEMSCDDLAVRGMKLKEKKQYAAAIVQAMTLGKRKQIPAKTGFTDAVCRERVENIFTVKEHSLLGTGLRGILACVLLGLCFTRIQMVYEYPAEKEERDFSAYEEDYQEDSRNAAEDKEAVFQEQTYGLPVKEGVQVDESSTYRSQSGRVLQMEFNGDKSELYFIIDGQKELWYDRVVTDFLEGAYYYARAGQSGEVIYRPQEQEVQVTGSDNKEIEGIYSKEEQ